MFPFTAAHSGPRAAPPKSVDSAALLERSPGLRDGAERALASIVKSLQTMAGQSTTIDGTVAGITAAPMRDLAMAHRPESIAATISCAGLSCTLLVTLDPTLVHGVVELLAGGNGSEPLPSVPRAATSIDQQYAQIVVTLAASAIETEWAANGFGTSRAQRLDGSISADICGPRVSQAGVVTLAANQAANGNYAAATASTTFTASAQSPTLTFAPVPSQTFGGAPFTVSATSASPGTVTYSVVSGPATISGSTVTVTGAGTIVLAASQAASGTYAAATTNTTVNVAAATPVLSFAPIAAHNAGDAPFTVSATSASSGAVTYAVVSGPATISGNTVTITGNGPVVLSATQAASGNYASATTSTNFAVGTQTPVLSFAPIPPHSYGDAPFTVSATSASSGAVTYNVISGPATISSNTVTITGAGTVLLGASQAAAGGYSAATANATITIGAAVPTLAFAPIAPQVYGTAPISVSATSASSGAVTYVVVSGPATISGNSVTTTGVGTVILSASQAASGSYASAVATTTFSVTAAAPTLTFAPISSQTYGNAPFSVSATSVSSGAVTYSVVSGPATVQGNTVTLTGSGTVVLAASQAANGSYSAATSQTSFQVATETPTLTFAPTGAHNFGDAPFAVSASSASSGAITYSVISGPATIVGNTVTLTGTGAVVLGASQAATGSYSAASAQLTINAGTQTPTLVFAPIASHTYGDTAFAVSATSASPGTVTYAVVSGPATIAGNIVTITGTGTVALSASQAASGNYTAAGPASASFSVLPATPTLVFAPIAAQTFGGTPFKVTASSASTGAVTYSVLSGPATISGNTVTLTGNGTVTLGASQAADANHTAATTTAIVNVGVATPTLTFAPIASHTYGDAPFTVTASSASSGTITYSVASGPATITGNTVTLTGVGTVVLSASQAAASGYGAASASASVAVALATPTLTFTPVPAHTYGDAPFAVSASSASSGPITYAITAGAATISGSTVTLNGIGSVTVTANQAAMGNYAAAAAASVTFNVAASAPTLAFAPIGAHTYGDVPFTVTATSASAGPVVYAVQSGPATISGNTVTLTGSGTVVLTANQAAFGNYAAAAQATATVAVSNATPTLAFTQIPNHTYGDAPFTVTAISPSSGTITYAVQSGNATITGNTVTITGLGTVVLSANQVASGSYNAAAQVTTSFTVSAATPTLAFTSVPNHTFGDAAFTVVATSPSPAPIVYGVQSGNATMSGNLVTITGIGPVVLTANQAASGNYNAAAQVTATFTVNPAVATLTFLPVPNHTYGDPQFTVTATSTSLGPIVYAVQSGPATISGNTVSLNGIGTVVLTANQAASGNYAAAAQVSTSFNVVAETPTLTFTTIPNHTYGDAPFTVTASSASSGAITYSVTSGNATISGNTVTITGTGTVTLAASQAAAGNYAASSATTSFAVALANPTITFTIPNHTYGDPAFTVAATSASTGSFTYTLVSGSATVSGNTVTLSGSGPVTLKASQAADANYNAASVNATFTVGGATPTIVFSVPNHTYGDAPFTVSATSNSPGTLSYAVVSGNASISGSTVTLTGAGPVTLSASQPAAGNYVAGSTNAAFNVATESAPITFVVANHTYGDAPFTVSATSASSGAFTYTVQSGPATISGNTVTITGAGTVVLGAAQAASGGFGANSTTASFNVAQNVKIGPITPASSTVAPGNVTFNATVQGGFTDTLTWSASAGSFSGNVWTSPNTAGTYAITATSVDDPTKSVSTTITVSKPVLTLQPISTNLCGSGGLTLSVTASYAATYQWYLGGVAIKGATGATYNIGAVQASVDAGLYTVLVSNPAGSVLSAGATVVIGSTIVTQPVSLSIGPLQTANFTVAVVGEPLFKYQWYEISAGGTVGAAIAGANLPVYAKAAISLGDNGEQFYVVVTDACGNKLVSASATLTVASGNVPPSITLQPVSATVAVGGTPTFTVVATGTPTLTYQWYVIPAGSVTGTAVTGATAASYTLPTTATGLADDQDKYYVVVSNGYGQAVSNNATLAVGNGILITQQPQTVFTNPGQLATYSVTAVSLLPLTYQWYEAAPGSSTFTAIANATSSTYTQASTALADTGSVFYVAVSNGGTAAVNSASASLFVGALANIPNCSSNWTLVGNAQTSNNGCSYQLTAAQQEQQGDIVWPTLISTGNLQLSFTVTTTSASNPPADGYAVVLGDPSLGATTASVGANGQGLGAKGIPGLVIAFDEYYNAGDPIVPYLGVGRGEAPLWENPYFYVNTNIPALAQVGKTIAHNYTVTLVNGFMTVTMDGNQVFSGLVNAPPVAYLYVTSSTGSLYQQAVVSNISATVSAP